jgi:hypothetical protein
MAGNLKKIIIIIVVLVLGYFAYTLFVKESDNSESLISGTQPLTSRRNLADAQILGDQITRALNQIESLTLDRSIFENSIFKTLNDRSEPISEEPVGRKNPFAPISDTSVNYGNENPEDEGETGDDGTDDPVVEGDSGSDAVPASLSF